MELRVLHYFLTVARKQSFSKAAEELHITQPTLSRQIKELEETYHVTLFKRDTRHVELTEEGLLLKKRAEEILRLVRVTSEELTNPEVLAGDIHIACPESNSMNLIAKVIQRASQEQPHIRFHLYSGNAEYVNQMVDSGEADFGIVIGQNHLEKYDFFPLPEYEHWGMYMPKDDPLVLKEVITPVDIKGIPLIMSSQDMISSKFHGWARANKEPLKVLATYNLIDNGLLLSKHHAGYCIGLEHMSCLHNESLCFKRLSPPLIDHSMVIWRKYHLFTKVTEYFIMLLQKMMYEENENDRERKNVGTDVV